MGRVVLCSSTVCSTGEDEMVEAENDDNHERRHFGDGEDERDSGGELDAQAVDRREYHCAHLHITYSNGIGDHHIYYWPYK